MEGTLKVTPEKLKSTAREFQSDGDKISNLTTEMMELVTGLNSIWEGGASSAYITKFKGLQDDIQKMINMVKEHVNDLNDMADNYLKIEKENEEAANSLSSDVIS